MTATASETRVAPAIPTRLRRSATRIAAGSWRRTYAQRLALGDTAAVLVGVAACHLLVFGPQGGAVVAHGSVSGVFDQLEVSLSLAVAWLLSLAVVGSRSRRIIGEGSAEYKRVVDAAALTFVAFLLAVFFLQLDLSRLWTVLVFATVAVLTVANRWGWRQWLAGRRRAGQLSSGVVLVGSRKSVTATARDLLRLPQYGLTPVAVCLTGSAQPGSLQVAGHTLPAVRSTSSIADAMGPLGATTVMVTGSQHLSAKKIREMSWSLDPNRHQLLLAPSITDVAINVDQH